MINQCEKSPSVDSVNKLRELHATLLNKYSKYLWCVF